LKFKMTKPEYKYYASTRTTLKIIATNPCPAGYKDKDIGPDNEDFFDGLIKAEKE